MIDQQRQREQPSQVLKIEAAGNGWGDPISRERQRELQAFLDHWEAEKDHGERKGPFDYLDLDRRPIGELPGWPTMLTGADVSWLARQSGRDEYGGVPNLHLEGAYLYQAHLEGADLQAAHLEGAYLDGAYLEGADLGGTHLERTSLVGAHLKRATLNGAYLEGASLNGARLEGAILTGARLGGATLYEAHLEGAYLNGAHLEGADLSKTNVQRANLRGARFDENTQFAGMQLRPGFWQDWLDHYIRLRNRNAALGDIKWRGADLTAIHWEQSSRLGDERRAGLLIEFLNGVDAHRAIVRAYRQVAAHLRDQGMAEAADRFAYRAQVCERGVLWSTFRLPQYLFSWVLALLAGYGYRPGRGLFWYVAVILGFAYVYLQTGQVDGHAFNMTEALVFSVTSFHGRGFFPGGLNLDDPITIGAALEAVIGLFIEISFIATFTQRYFGAR